MKKDCFFCGKRIKSGRYCIICAQKYMMGNIAIAEKNILGMKTGKFMLIETSDFQKLFPQIDINEKDVFSVTSNYFKKLASVVIAD